MNARNRLEAMLRTDQGSTTVWSPQEVSQALDAYRAEVLHEAADRFAQFPTNTSRVLRGMAAEAERA